MAISRRGAMLTGVAAGAASVAGLAVGAPAEAPLEVTLGHPDGRATRYRALLPDPTKRWGLVLFSHGANSSNRDYDRIWRVWADAGYLVIGPDHVDTGPPATQVKLAPAELWRTRLADTTLPLRRREAFDAWARANGAAIDWSRVGVAGHSFGAVVAQALVGARIAAPGGGAPPAAEPTIKACVALSPPGPLKGFIPADAWSTVTTPSLLQTGDADILPGFVDDWRSRLTGFAGAPDRWRLVGHGVDHYFHGLICRLKPGADADLPALAETSQISRLFLDAYLREDGGALERLRSRARIGDDGVATFGPA